MEKDNLLTRVRPEYHCPHVGRTGGEKCVPHTYQSWFNVDFVENLQLDTFASDDCVASCPVNVTSVPVNR